MVIKNVFFSSLKRLKMMSSDFVYLKNTGWVLAGRFIEAIVSYFLILLISYYLGVQGLGDYSFIFSFAGLFFLFAEFGLSSLMIKDLSRKYVGVARYYSNVLSSIILFSTISFLLYIGTVFFMGRNELIIPLFLVGIFGFINAIRYGPMSILIIKNKGKFLAFINLLERVLVLLFGVFALILFNSLIFFVLVIVFANIIKLILLFYQADKFVRFKFVFEWVYIKKLMQKSYPFLLILLFTFIYVQLDTVMLSFMKGNLVVGLYQASYKFINMLSLIPAMLVMFGFPLFSKFYSKNKILARNFLEKLIHLSFFIMLPVIAIIWWLGDKILFFVYRFNAIESVVVFNILVVAELFVFFTTIMGNVIAAADKQHIFARIGGVGAVVNIFLNFILIPKYSLYGAASATLITYVLMFLLMWIYIRKKLFPFSFLKYLWFPLLCGIIIAVELYLLRNSSLFLSLLFAFLTYLVCLLIFFYVKKNIYFVSVK